MTRPTLRVHLQTHHDGRITGRLVPSGPIFDDPPVGYGDDQASVLSQLALAIEESSASLDAYHWREPVALRRISLEFHPRTVIAKRVVVGRRAVPVRVGYLWAKLAAGGFKVVVPPMGWNFVLEDLEMAPDVLRQALATTLLGEKAGVVHGLADVRDEQVIEWWPTLSRKHGAGPAARRDAGRPTLDAIAEDLVERELRRPGRRLVGQFDFSAEQPLIVHERPRSMLLVGPAGSGKTAWIRALARWLGKRDAEGPSPRIWASSADRIVAGMKYLGMWEQRCLDLVGELSGEGDLLYFDRLAPVLAPQTGRSSIADLLLPAIAAGDIAVISECTREEHERLIQRAPNLMALFHVVRIDPPAPSAMPQLLATWQQREHPHLAIDGAGWRRLVQHLELFQRDLAFPGKAFRMLDALAKLHPPPSQPGSHPLELDAEAVSRDFASVTGLPLELISDAKQAGREYIATRLRAGVVGQDEACSTAARVLTRLKAGLNDPERPVGSLFFVGPTGVGKTELAKQLARYMFGDASKMIRVDMSEYMLPGSAQRLLGSGSGTRSLVERVRERPLSLVLFDEIEKAHASVFDLLLGLLGEGRLTDHDGRLVDFRMTLVVMTSNIGVARSAAVGLAADTGAGDVVGAVRNHFRPEFFNRIDHVIAFRALASDDIRKIVDLELGHLALRAGLQRRRLRLLVDTDVRDLLAELGWHPTRGARPLKRVIEDRVVAPLAVAMSESPELSDREIVVVLAGSDREAELRRAGRTLIAVAR